MFNKSACAFSVTDVGRDGATYQECSDWNRAVVDELHALAPDLLVTNSSAAGTPFLADDLGDRMDEALART